ncbi:sec-independent protein translocase protein TatA [Labedella gwakjiensis]|uniref:Sec-independent protein translocase protein TatA n=1 Tax=Labedella gwakjiensis TaxID=390269 RepID=A0A2P8GS71_9MICO|nr:twin-arginine translocase TatA/TatE family subunit [Labedella gwakjiensis]PSL36823.1 sec-independent protein translocase protein TatA [Labedella gwakjiensis]RUQ84329.1 twin-arginine translocase TatA/TatE family subunit [Labedella gwakjiensis]
MLQNLTGWHALIILAIVLLVFGAAKLPSLARSVGQSVRILKAETSETTPDRADSRETSARTATADDASVSTSVDARTPEHTRP